MENKLTHQPLDLEAQAAIEKVSSPRVTKSGKQIAMSRVKRAD